MQYQTSTAPVEEAHRADCREAHPLTKAAHDDLVTRLQQFGNKLSQRHSDALEAVLNYYTEMATGERTGRYAFPLGTSLGKTQSVVAWCAAVDQLELPYTVLVCQEQIETLSDLYGDLIDRGIPAEKIGIVHTDGNAEVPSSDGDPREYQFLLVTHAMIKSGNDVERYTELYDEDHGEYWFGQRYRHVTVWDESLVKSNSLHQAGSELSASLKYVEDKANGEFTNKKPSADLQAALEYLQAALQQITKRHKALCQKEQTASNKIELEELDAETISKWSQEIRGLKAQGSIESTLLAFLNNSQEQLRLVRLGQGDSSEGVIACQLKIPSGLQNIIVLDASAAIRHLLAKDEDLQIIDAYEDVKSFERFEVEQVKTKGGNGYLRRELRKNSPLVKEIVNDIVGGWLPQGHACLIASVKPEKTGKPGPIDKIKAALRDAGVDLEETISVRELKPEGGMIWRQRPRFVFVTWGQERATNRYRHCSHIIAAGVLRRDELELSAQTGGQRENLLHPDVTDRADIKRTQASEQFYRLQQLLGRGTSRKTEHGVAAPSWARVYDQADFEPFAQKGMPGVQWTCREAGVYVKPANKAPKPDSKTSELARQIAEWLKQTALERVSVRELKLALGATKVPKKTFQRAVEQALRASPEWRRDAGSLQKGPSDTA